MAKVKLTAPKVEGFTCPPDKLQAFLWDSDVPGLALRATKKGAKAYVFQSRVMGEPIRMTIGDPSVWPLNNRMDRAGPGGKVLQGGAREEARRLQAVIRCLQPVVRQRTGAKGQPEQGARLLPRSP